VHRLVLVQVNRISIPKTRKSGYSEAKTSLSAAGTVATRILMADFGGPDPLQYRASIRQTKNTPDLRIKSLQSYCYVNLKI
jgi:hypothetical protein